MFNNLVLKRLFILCFLLGSTLVWGQSYNYMLTSSEPFTPPDNLTLNRLTSGQISSTNNFGPKLYTYKIPKEAAGVKITLFNQKYKLGLYAGYEYDPISGSVLGASKEVFSSYNEMQSITTLVLDRFKDSNYKDGDILIKVSFVDEENDFSYSGSKSETVQNVNFMIKIEQISTPSAITLTSGKSYSFNLNNNSNFVCVYKIEVTNEKQPIIFNFKGEDEKGMILFNQGKVVWRAEEANYAQDLSSIEKEFIMGTSDVPLTKGTLYISVLSFNQQELKGTILANVVKQNNINLMPLNSLPQKRGNDYESSMSSLVGVTTAYGSYCGAFVSQKGHVLTSLSAIKDPSGKVANEISIMLSISPSEAPIYAFKAKMIKSYPEGDLALLALTSMAMDRPVPTGMKFPYVPIATGMNIEVGQPAIICGFPVDTLRGTVSSPFVLQNIVGGFEKRGGVNLFKSVAIAGGMGGIVFNIYFELIGVTSPQNKTASQTTTLFAPTKFIPSDWKDIIEGF